MYMGAKADADTHKKKKRNTSARKLTQISKKNEGLNASKLTTESDTPFYGAYSTLPFLYAVAKAGRKSPEPVKDPLSPQLG
jgi:hypothetical protein